MKNIKEIEVYEQGWEDRIKECLNLAKNVDDTYMIDCLKRMVRI